MQNIDHQVVAGIIRRGDEIMLVEQQAPHDPESGWALPGGRVEPGELLPEALAREIAEETGIVVREIGRLAYIAQFHNAFPVTDANGVVVWQPGLSTTFVFEVSDWKGVLHTADPDGYILQARFLPLTDTIAKLNKIPLRVMSEPIVAYLRGETKLGTIWFYRRLANSEDELVARLNTEH